MNYRYHWRVGLGLVLMGLCVGLGVAYAQKPVPVDPSQPVAIIAGPTETPAGELVEFDAGDSNGAGYAWEVSGPSSTEGRWKVYEGERFLAFASPEPGRYRITLAVAMENQAAITHIILDVGGEPNPDPDPDDPPIPGTKWQVVIVHESDRLDNLSADQQSLIKGLAFRERLKAAGHKIPIGGVIDADAPNPQGGVPEAQAAFLSACKGKSLPRLCLGPLEGGTIRTFPLPASEAAVFALLGDKP